MQRKLTHLAKSLLTPAAVATLFVTGVAASPAQARHTTGDGSQRALAAAAGHAGMTWVVRSQTPVGLVSVGADDRTDPYSGDTPAAASLPMLCLYVDNSPVPAGITPDFYEGWARGWVGLTPPIAGTQLTSPATAHAICASRFGTGWRMAEFHDGWYGNPPTRGGWHYWAHGAIPTGTRFWTWINDQNANPWN